jgi:hypothetical protein
MDELDGREPDDPRFEELLAKLMAAIRHHVEDEEGKLLPRLSEACSVQELEELGGKVLSAKKMAPTRPHRTGRRSTASSSPAPV